jgi:hypothetical protein
VSAVDIGSLALAAALAGIALLACWIVDHPRVSRPTRRLEVTLELVFNDVDALRRHLEERLNARVLDVWVLEIDYVRETTRAAVRYEASPDSKPVPEEALDASIRGR